MKIGNLIFCRLNSKRLPNKALLDINGQTLLERVISRSKSVAKVEGVAVATTTRPEDDKVESVAAKHNIRCFRGSSENVALRAALACQDLGWDGFVRICGDRPFFDPKIVQQAVCRMKYGNYEIISTLGVRKLPPGLTTEVLALSTLQKHLPFFDSSHREHLTSYFYENSQDFRICYLDFPDISVDKLPTTLAIDDAIDYERAKFIASQIDNKEDAGFLDAATLTSLALAWDRANLPRK